MTSGKKNDHQNSGAESRSCNGNCPSWTYIVLFTFLKGGAIQFRRGGLPGDAHELMSIKGEGCCLCQSK